MTMRNYCEKYCQDYQAESNNPFYLVDWSEDYLHHIQDLVAGFERQGILRQDIVLVFPHDRPKRYLTARYKKWAKEKKQVSLLPKILTSSEFYTLCLHHFERGLPLFSEQSELDRCARLFFVVREILQKNSHSHFASSMDFRGMEADEQQEALQMAKFYPWARSLDKLFEECFQHLVLPQNIRYTDGEVSGFAQSLLEELEQIFQCYVKEMQANNQTSPAYDLYRTAKYIEAYDLFKNGQEQYIAPRLAMGNNAHYLDERYFADFTPYLLQGKSIVFAGFVNLSKAEDCILRYFWQRGACISLYTDSRLAADRKNSHYSCEQHKKWLTAWKADVFLAENIRKKPSKPNISFIPAYDVHSQLAEMKKDIQPLTESIEERDDFISVVLPTPSLLMPVLHELPNKNINISLGYPVQRTLLWQFAELLFALQENRIAENGTVLYLVNDIKALLHHPYTKMLLGQSTGQEEYSDRQNVQILPEDFPTWRKMLYESEKFLLAHRAVHIDLARFKEIFYQQDEMLDEAFLDEFFSALFTNWENVQTLLELGNNFNAMADFLTAYGAGVWNRFPLDKEGLVRFLQNTVPSLMQNAMAEEELPMQALFDIARQFVLEERVPFEADPLTGLQVLGMLETRLLAFENVFLLDCTESNLPALQKQDPLMPDSLRSVLGFPDRHSREILVAHTFYSLVNSAENVCCYWQEGVQSSEIQSSKSVRSRFIEELIWEREKELFKQGELAHADLLRKSACEPRVAQRREKRAIVKSPEIQKALELYLTSPEQGLSAQGLNAYLQCPVKFYYHYLAKIKENEELELGNNYTVFGTKMHDLLKDLYGNGQAGKVFHHSEENFAKLMENFAETFSKENWKECLAADSYYMLQETGKFFLNKYWQEYQEKSEEVEIIALEQKFSVLFPHADFGNAVKLFGFADKIEKRGDEWHILDYKTSKINKKAMKIWYEEDFFADLQAFNKSQETGKKWDSKKAGELFALLAEKIEDIQLPYYLYLFFKDFAKTQKTDKDAKIHASWIFLGERSKPCELSFLPYDKSRMWDVLAKIREEYMENILTFVLNHMGREKKWQCKEGKYCQYCPFADYC